MEMLTHPSGSGPANWIALGIPHLKPEKPKKKKRSGLPKKNGVSAGRGKRNGCRGREKRRNVKPSCMLSRNNWLDRGKRSNGWPGRGKKSSRPRDELKLRP